MSTDGQPALNISHDTAQRRFVASNLEGLEVGHLTYDTDCVTMTVVSTVVDPRFSGRGYAAQLARRALDFARDQGWQVVPQCSYIDTFVSRNPGYAELIVD